MIARDKELEIYEKAALLEKTIDLVLRWSNCPLEEVDSQHYQGRCGRMGYEIRNVLYHAGAIKSVKEVQDEMRI